MEKNKKGSIGYIVRNWNHLGQSRSMPEKGIVQFSVSHVKILSCGKKQMTLEPIGDGFNRRMFYDPKTPVFSNSIEYSKAVDDMFQDWKEASLLVCKKRISVIEGLPESERKPYMIDDIANALKLIKLIKEDSVPYEAVMV